MVLKAVSIIIMSLSNNTIAVRQVVALYSLSQHFAVYKTIQTPAGTNSGHNLLSIITAACTAGFSKRARSAESLDQCVCVCDRPSCIGLGVHKGGFFLVKKVWPINVHAI